MLPVYDRISLKMCIIGKGGMCVLPFSNLAENSSLQESMTLDSKFCFIFVFYVILLSKIFCHNIPAYSDPGNIPYILKQTTTNKTFSSSYNAFLNAYYLQLNSK